MQACPPCALTLTPALELKHGFISNSRRKKHCAVLPRLMTHLGFCRDCTNSLRSLKPCRCSDSPASEVPATMT